MLSACQLHQFVNLVGAHQASSPRRKDSLAVTTMLWSSRDGSRALLADLGLQLLISAAGMDTERLWRQGNIAVQLVRRYKLGLSLVPCGQDLGRRRTSQDSRMDQSRELDVWDVS